MFKPLYCMIALWAVICTQTILAAETAERESQLFDFGWRFSKGDISVAQTPEFNDSQWRTVDLPHDWSIEDLPPVLESQSEPDLYVTKGSWKFKEGDDPAWKETKLDDTQWKTVKLPATWESHSNITADNVYGWYRRKVTVPESYRGKDVWLELGYVDDVDQTYFNGQLIGSTGSFPPDFRTAHQERRRYRIPKEQIRYGEENSVAVRVFDGYGSGGMYAPAIPRTVSGPFDSEAPGGINTGFTIGGEGWYRKHFKLPNAWQGKTVAVQFEGVYMNADVWINGHHLGNHPYGYTSFTYDLTKYLHFGDKENVLAVSVKNLGINSRWYAGSGIYRHVWLKVTDPIHIKQSNPVITTPSVRQDRAIVRVQSSIDNKTGQPADLSFKVAVVDANGNEVVSDKTSKRADAQGTLFFDQQLNVDHPKLWSPDTPYLYKTVCELQKEGQIIDRVETPFGIRSIRFDPDKGFFLNGQKVLLKGGALHDNNGPLGAASYDRAEERKVELLKAAGFNMLRSGHNPRSPAFLAACDRVGMMVLEEAFDMWRVQKLPDDYHLYFDDWWKRDLTAMIENGRNHPSVILWSIGSEIREAYSDQGVRTAGQLAAFVRTLDPNRGVNSNVNRMGGQWTALDPFFATLDVGGYSYAKDYYESDHQRVPNRAIFATETNPRDAFDYWMKVVDLDYVAGNVVWTAMDYMGESSNAWWSYGHSAAEVFPWTSAFCGDLDICGFKRPPSYYRDVLWNNGNKISAFVHCPVPSFEGPGNSPWGWDDVKSSWTWPGQEGKSMQVDVYSACEQVRLMLNGKDLGIKPTSRETRFIATWNVPYEPGTLTAVGYDKSKEVARWELRTVGEPASIRLSADRPTIKADGQDLCYVTLEIVDKMGFRHPQSEKLINFSIEGEGTLIGVGSGRPNCLESFQQPKRTTYEGRCLAIIKSKSMPGTIKLTAQSSGLEQSSVEIKTLQNEPK